MLYKVIRFFDKLEDRVRGKLSHYPLLYSFIGGVAVVLFWKGVWDVADTYEFMFGYASLAISSVILMVTGLFVSFFISDRIVLSGLKKEKKLVEKTEEEIRAEENLLVKMNNKLEKIENELKELKEKMK